MALCAASLVGGLRASNCLARIHALLLLLRSDFILRCRLKLVQIHLRQLIAGRRRPGFFIVVLSFNLPLNQLQLLLILNNPDNRALLFDELVSLVHAHDDFTCILHEHGKPLLLIVLPFTQVLGSIRIVLNAVAVSLAVEPIPFVSVAHEFAFPLLVEPNMDSESVLHVVFPIAVVFLIGFLPLHDPVAIFLVVLPLTIV